jgi:hypothetical protein
MATAGSVRCPDGHVRRIALRIAVVATAVLAVTAGALELMRLDSGPVAGWARSSGNDALWMGRIWAEGDYTSAQFGQMADRIRDSGISDVYVFVGQMSPDGHLDHRTYADAAPSLAAPAADRNPLLPLQQPGASRVRGNGRRRRARRPGGADRNREPPPRDWSSAVRRLQLDAPGLGLLRIGLAAARSGVPVTRGRPAGGR